MFHVDRGPPGPYPELEDADREIVSNLRRILGDREPHVFDDLLADLKEEVRPDWIRPASPRRGSVRAARRYLYQAGDGAALALLKVLYDFAAAKPKGSWWIPRHYQEDGSDRTLVGWLRERADPTLDPILLRMVADRDLHFQLRVDAVSVLAREGNAAALDPLVTLALDPDEIPDLREQIIYRLPRLGLPMPVRLRELLYLPFRDLDVAAAGTLVLTGDPEAPSLVADGLWQRGRGHGFLYHLAPAARVLARSDPEVDRIAGAILEAWPVIPKEEEHRALREAFVRWLDAHPEVRQTQFERERRAYFESDRRRRELALTDFEAIAAAPEEEIDLAAASIVLSPWPERLRQNLESIWRLACLLRRDLDGVEDPERVIEKLNQRLLGGRFGIHHPEEPGFSSFLPRVLLERAGDCLGMTTLYLGVCDRLDLPVFAVEAPHHVFLRWDDGSLKRNIESQAGGAERSDDEYAGKEGARIHPSSRERGVFLRNLGKKELLSFVLVNRAWFDFRQKRHEEARALAERALALWPESTSALSSRATFTMSLDPEAESILADLDTVLELHPLAAESHALAGAVLLTRGEHREALARTERALEIDPDCDGAAHNRVLCLLRLGRLDEAERRVEEMAGAEDLEWSVQTLRIRLRVHRGEDDWEDGLDSEEDADRRHVLACVAAEALLERGEPRRALQVLRRVFESSEASESVRASAYVLEGRARAALGDRERAVKALETARERGATRAETLALEKAIGE